MLAEQATLMLTALQRWGLFYLKDTGLLTEAQSLVLL
jgi:hypothetical protein